MGELRVNWRIFREALALRPMPKANDRMTLEEFEQYGKDLESYINREIELLMWEQTFLSHIGSVWKEEPELTAEQALEKLQQRDPVAYRACIALLNGEGFPSLRKGK